MKSSALLFGVAVLFALAPAAAFATTTPASPQPRCTISASRGSVELGKTVNLSWQSQYATQGFITSIGTVGTEGMQGVIPTGNGTTYIGTFTGPGGVGKCSITISIIQPNGTGGGGTIEGPGTVPEPDKLPPSQGAGAPTTLPPANDITLSNTQSKGLISCGDTTGLTPGTAAYYAAATNCEACSLASLAQKIINFLIGLSIPLAAAMFAYAGVIYFTSGVVDKLEKAHKIFKSVGIGFMIVLCAWLGIQTVLKTILDPSYYRSWNTIQCVGTGARPMNATIGQLLSTLPGLNTNALTPAPTTQLQAVQVQNYDGSFGGAVQCQNGSTWSQGALNCVDESGEITAPLSTSGPANASISAAALAYYGTDTTNGPDSGNKACAWAVNNILQSAGVDPIDGDSVALMENALKNGGRGTLVTDMAVSGDLSNTSKGDIVVFGGMSHVGICDNDGCTRVVSNTGGRGNSSFSGLYPPTQGSRIYRVNN